MATGINTTSTTGYDDFKSLGLTHTEETKIDRDSKQIGDFMRLFIEQLKHQNPMEPQEGADFLAQISQMQSVEELRNVQKSVTDMSESFQSSRILEATSMIGKSIEVPSNQMMLKTEQSGHAKSIKGEVMIPNLGEDDTVNNVLLNVYDPVTSEIIQTYQFGPQSSNASVPFQWNGNHVQGEQIGERLSNSGGEPIMDGPYRVQAQAQINGQWRNVSTMVSTSIDSVSIDKDTNELTLNASSIGQVKLSELQKIHE
ncbi:MAG: hypothetical protein HON32_06380 [Francisellaceae bacterium]|jgi:flagellar basal-body rod modification protein FlgD|nr:hypothetical protein [Francisellaceae bacterium]